MDNDISKEWKSYKEEMKASIEEAIERGNVNVEVLKMMINMLEHSKLKPRRDNKDG